MLRTPGNWAGAVEEISRRHALDGPFQPSVEGSAVVWLSASRCIKLHPPLAEFLDSFRRETATLHYIAGRLPIPTPAIVAEGTLGDWPYFVATRLEGTPIDRVWPGLDAATRTRVAEHLGVAMAALHGLPAAPLADLGEPWPEFRREQRARCLAREREKQLDPQLEMQLAAWLTRSDALSDPEFTPALLHTEIGPHHLLVSGDRLTGLIDFGEAMVGDPDYDIAPVGLFVTRGDASAFGAFARAYGRDDATLRDPDYRARLLRHALMHRFGTLAWYLRVLGPPTTDLGELADFWFGAG